MSVDSDVTDIDETDESTEVAQQALVGLCNQLVDQIAAGRAEVAVRQALALSAPPDPPRSREWRDLGPAALGFAQAANPDLPVTPDRRGGHYCDICGCADEKQIQPGPDAEHFGADRCAWMCKDERACEARKLHRYPPRPDLVPEAFLSALGQEDEARAARSRPPAGQQEPPAGQEPAAGQQEPARQEEPPVPGWTFTPFGSMDPLGSFHPAPQYGPYAHTLMNPQHRAHLLSGQPRPHYYGGAHYIAPEGADSQQDGQQGQREPQAGPAVPAAEGLSPGQAEALYGGRGTDLPLVPQAAAVPQRPARRSRGGPRSYYRGKFRGR